MQKNSTYASYPEILRKEHVANLTGFSERKALCIIKDLNDELQKKGYYILQGRIGKKYLFEKLKLPID
ncbi:MAG: hypothetical protein ACRDCC_08625 [Culicoidibacterales bacterium]